MYGMKGPPPSPTTRTHKTPPMMLSYLRGTSRLALAPRRRSDSPAATRLGRKAFNTGRCVILMSAPLTAPWMAASASVSNGRSAALVMWADTILILVVRDHSQLVVGSGPLLTGRPGGGLSGARLASSFTAGRRGGSYSFTGCLFCFLFFLLNLFSRNVSYFMGD